MKKGQTYEGIVEQFDFPNKGIVFLEEGKVIVKNALPGQKVRFLINKARKGKFEARLLEVIDRSPMETRQAPCKDFGACGGCTFQSMPYETQLELKKNQVKKLIDGVCDDYEFEGIKGSPVEFAYRNKMEFSFGDEVKDGPLALGLHKKGSFHDIVTADTCQIVDEDYNKILTCVLTYFQERGVGFYKKMRHEGFLRHLLVRRAVKTGETLISLVTSSQEEMDLTELKDALLALELSGKVVGILHVINDSLADVVRSDRTEILYGQDYFYEELLGLKFKISTFSFFQTNSLGAEVLYSTAREYVGETKDKLIFDLYSGTGTIAQILAPVAKKVIGVEIVEEAVEAAKENAALNGLTNCEFIAGDVLKVIDTIEEKPDLIVLDPPRDGINPKALTKIIDYGVDRLVYISCKPTSLARDLVMLQERGYKVEKVCAVDMFPQTVHVETVCLLKKVK
ncbi:RNA methyltransferase, TrmA family [Lachnospiraceae bacterium KM106-2]|nr:RNA methyltransferase, TrmA family [Lachnospiraceae bacterium KM106-2]